MPRGIPDSLMVRDNRAKRIDVNILPPPDEAVRMYVNDGGTLTDSGPFGTDPIADYPDKVRIRETSFFERYPSFSDLFHELVNGNPVRFKEALLFHVDITKRLSSS